MKELGLWAGVGVQGEAKFFVGADYTRAILFSLNDREHEVRFADTRIIGKSISFGLGCAVDCCFILAWGIRHVREINKLDGDYGFDFDLDIGPKGMGSSLAELKGAGRFVHTLGNVIDSLDRYRNIIDSVNGFLDRYELIKALVNPSRRNMLVLPIPAAGIGFNVSVGKRKYDTTIKHSGVLDFTHQHVRPAHAPSHGPHDQRHHVRHHAHAA